jgi:hypothetical protein
MKRDATSIPPGSEAVLGDNKGLARTASVGMSGSGRSSES